MSSSRISHKSQIRVEHKASNEITRLSCQSNQRTRRNTCLATCRPLQEHGRFVTMPAVVRDTLARSLARSPKQIHPTAMTSQNMVVPLAERKHLGQATCNDTLCSHLRPSSSIRSTTKSAATPHSIASRGMRSAKSLIIVRTNSTRPWNSFILSCLILCQGQSMVLFILSSASSSTIGRAVDVTIFHCHFPVRELTLLH